MFLSFCRFVFEFSDITQTVYRGTKLQEHFSYKSLLWQSDFSPKYHTFSYMYIINGIINNIINNNINRAWPEPHQPLWLVVSQSY